jgi:hypothetical protein
LHREKSCMAAQAACAAGTGSLKYGMNRNFG